MGTDLKLAHKIQKKAQARLDKEYAEQATHHPKLDYLTVLAIVTALLGDRSLAEEVLAESWYEVPA